MALGPSSAMRMLNSSPKITLRETRGPSSSSTMSRVGRPGIGFGTTVASAGSAGGSRGTLSRSVGEERSESSVGASGRDIDMGIDPSSWAATTEQTQANATKIQADDKII